NLILRHSGIHLSILGVDLRVVRTQAMRWLARCTCAMALGMLFACADADDAPRDRNDVATRIARSTPQSAREPTSTPSGPTSTPTATLPPTETPLPTETPTPLPPDGRSRGSAVPIGQALRLGDWV